MTEMTDSPFPTFSDAAPEGEASGGGRRPALVAGMAAAALLLAGGGFVLLSGGGEEEDFSVPTTAAAPAVPEAAPAPEALPVKSEVSFARNPFEPQYIEPRAAGGADGEKKAPTDTPKEIIQQSDPSFVPQQTAVVVVQQPAQQTPTTTSPTQQPTQQPTTAPTQQPAPQPTDDGVRYPITLMALDVTEEGSDEKRISWGWRDNGFEVLPGQPFGRFRHLRVMQVFNTAEKAGVMLQMGDGSPYFVAVGETVYVL